MNGRALNTQHHSTSWSVSSQDRSWLAPLHRNDAPSPRILERQTPGSVVFLDFSEVDFDQLQTLAPARNLPEPFGNAY